MLSIIVPIYNAEKYLEECLNSILRSMDENTELLLINDGSTDKSESICKSYVEKSRVKYIYKENGGVYSARNLGIEKAEGDWIAFVDADDVIADDLVAQIEENIDDKAEEIIFNYSVWGKRNACSGRVSIIDSRKVCKYSLDNVNNKDNISNYFTYQNMIFTPCWGKAYKKEVIKNNNIKFGTNLKVSEDLIFNLEYLNKIKNVKLVDKVEYLYRINTDSVTHSYSIEYVENRIELIETLLDMNRGFEYTTELAFYILSTILRTLVYMENLGEKREEAKALFYRLMQKDNIRLIIRTANYRLLSNGKIQNIFYKLELFEIKRNRYRSALKIVHIYGLIKRDNLQVTYPQG